MSYYLFILPVILISGWAQRKVKSTYAQMSQVKSSSGLTGAEVARNILDANGLEEVPVERVAGELSDHYDPKNNILRLSEGVYGSSSVAAIGIAAHEAGHALQDFKKYAPLTIRNFAVPAASIGGRLGFFVLAGGVAMSIMPVVILGIALLSATVLFQLVNLPVEFDASNRAKEILANSGYVSAEEQKGVKKVLDAAAWTYVAATLGSIMTLVYYLSRSGLLGRR